MPEHITRKELKKDEFRDTLAHGAEAILSHKNASIYALVVLIVAALAVFGWKTYSERQTVKATAVFDAAMKTFNAPVRTLGQPIDPAQVSFADDASKYSEAAQKFAAAAAKFPRTRQGQLAGYYAALSYEKLNKDSDARKYLQPLANGDSDFAAMARFELAQLDDRNGQADAAAKLYQQLLDKPSVLVPKPLVLLAFAQHYAAKNPAEATRLYNQIKSEYPDTPVAEQADQELALLPGKS
ncbi:MAG TPA: tetratricopeptide repeat protein [Candidatus Acidoferrum sp.]|nr:tetratricopeptide repeat protein [Candidatus Acidoferrum sp.]